MKIDKKTSALFLKSQYPEKISTISGHTFSTPTPSYTPMVWCFFAAVSGILLDVFASVSFNVWLFLAITFLIFWFREHKLQSLSSSQEIIGAQTNAESDTGSENPENNENRQLLSTPTLRESVVFLGKYLQKNISLPSLATFLVIASFFGLWSHFYTNQFFSDEISLFIPKDGCPIILDAYIREMPVIIESPQNHQKLWGNGEVRTIFTVKAIQVRDRGNWRKIRGRVNVIVDGDMPELRIGDQIRLYGHLARILPRNNPEEYDQFFQKKSQRILSRLSVDNTESLTILKTGQKYPIARFFESLRRSALKTFQNHLTERNASLAAAMIIGIHDDITEETRALFQETGTIHLFAISGLHIALIAGFVLFCLKLVIRSDKILCIAFLLTLFFYFFLTDRQSPALRATILLTITAGGSLFHRQVWNNNALATAAVILLLLNPMELFQFGTHLSFLATGIFLWKLPEMKKHSVPRIEKVRILYRWKRFAPIVILFKNFGKRVLQQVWVMLQTGTLIWLVLLPLILCHINLLAPIAIIANPLIWIPMTGSLFSGMILMFSAWFCPCCSGLIAWFTNLFFNLLLHILEILHSVPPGFFRLPGPPLWWCMVFYIPLIFWTLFPRTRPSGRWILVGTLSWCLVYSYVYQWETGKDVREARLRIRIASVGHGAAVLLIFPDHRTVLYDCGSFSSPGKVAQIVARFLWNQGLNHLDLVLFSHADIDHYNAFEEIATLIPVRQVAVSPVMFLKDNTEVTDLKRFLETAKIPIREIAAGETIPEFPELSFLHPPHKNSFQANESNANSLVLEVEHLGRRFLFPGDLDSTNPPFLNSVGHKTDLLLAPHHGGTSQNAADLLKWSQPDWIVISGGSFQRNKATEQQLRDQGYHLLHTLDDGAIQIDITRPLHPKVPVTENSSDKPGTSIPGMMTVHRWKNGPLADPSPETQMFQWTPGGAFSY